ncbi:PREDICTED: mitochondrial import inner membrane translocase subunit Tim10 B, partial [Cariama cristata]|uniref:mitochondrial import inner membrane translocase subunit Tim10 B n=1 Tax=Cariama cristata TaxID=54380 RepID=UPI0005200C88
ETCLDSCAGKLVHSNHRLMSAYVALMPSIMQRRVSDYEASVAQVSQNSAQEGSVAATCVSIESLLPVARSVLCLAVLGLAGGMGGTKKGITLPDLPVEGIPT